MVTEAEREVRALTKVIRSTLARVTVREDNPSDTSRLIALAVSDYLAAAVREAEQRALREAADDFDRYSVERHVVWVAALDSKYNNGVSTGPARWLRDRAATSASSLRHMPDPYTATADTEYVWTRNDQADHDAGHPSGYDCDGDALSGSEACGHRYAATADTGQVCQWAASGQSHTRYCPAIADTRLRARVEALADEMTAYEDEYDPTSAGVTRVWGRRIRALLDATAAPTNKKEEL